MSARLSTPIRTHKIHTRDGLLACTIEQLSEDNPYVFPARDVTPLCAEQNALCVLEGDQCYMGMMGNPMHVEPYPVFWVEDALGQIASFLRMRDLAAYLADRY